MPILQVFHNITKFIVELGLIPQFSQGEFIVELLLPSGTPLNKTDNVLHKIQNYCLTIDKIATSFAVSGTGNKLNSSDDTGINTGDISIALKEGSNRDDENEVMAKLRHFLTKIPDLTYNFKRPTLFSFKPPLEIEINGYNLDEIEKLTLEINDKMEKSRVFTDIKNSIKIGQLELSIKFNREKAALLGIKIRDAANILANQLKGKNSTQFNILDTKIDVIIKGNSKELSSIEDVKSIIINPNQKRPITLGSIAEVKSDRSPAEILRSSQQRVATISSNITSKDLGTATVKLKNILKTIELPQGIRVNITGQNSEMDDSFNSLKFALIMAIFLVYLVMASQFESFIHPFVILFSIPLAFVGAILALYITGYPINVVVFIGGILLAGIVVNNAIVLIDLINQLREKGTEKIEAIITAGKLRLRSILMTTLTTTLGLLPLAMGLGKGAELRSPMAITVIGGLLVSTLLTLIVIPVVYSILDRKKY